MYSKKGVLLINLGTPDDTSFFGVARYLNAFLCDKAVIDLPFILRQCLVKGLILPFRTPKTQKAYQRIWTAAGSPLRTHTQALATALAETLSEQGIPVEVGMRYGNPSIPAGLTSLLSQGCDYVHVIPLYPQYATATTGTALDALFGYLQTINPKPHLHIQTPFYADPGFIQAWAERLTEAGATEPGHFTIFSFHGLPERQLPKVGCHQLTTCRQSHCPNPTQDRMAQYCYRAHSLATAKALAEKLGLGENQWTISFQSRLGNIPWLQPYTEAVLEQLHQQPIKKLLVSSPSFVADCLETLEELGIEAKQQWEAKTKIPFVLVESLNQHPRWVNTLKDWVLSS